MAYWDDENINITLTVKKEIWRTEIFGDVDGDPTFVFHIAKVSYENGVEISRKDLGTERILDSAAQLDPALEPYATKIKNGTRNLARALRLM